MSQIENPSRGSIGSCEICSREGTDLTHLGTDAGIVAANLRALARYQGEMAGRSLGRLRLIAGFRMLWRARRTERISKALFKESERLIEDDYRILMREVSELLEGTKTK